MRAKSSSERISRSDFVDDDCVHAAGFDVGQQALKSRAVHIAAREAAIVITIRQAVPAFGRLALDVCFRAFALGVECVELLLQTLLGALARVDRRSGWSG